MFPCVLQAGQAPSETLPHISGQIQITTYCITTYTAMKIFAEFFSTRKFRLFLYLTASNSNLGLNMFIDN